MIILRFNIILVISIIFSTKQYNVLVNNDLDLTEYHQLFKEIDLSD